MAGNRVEELEAKVRELEATISGLTDELVETKERVRALEEHVDLELDDIVEGQPSRMEAREKQVAGLQGRNGQSSEKPPKQEEVDEAVANADGEADDEDAADDAKSEEDEGEDESGSDDIIVA